MSNHTNNRGRPAIRREPSYIPQKLMGLKEEDTIFFHDIGNHGNYEMDSPRFNSDLFNPNCPKCKEREVRAQNRSSR